MKTQFIQCDTMEQAIEVAPWAAVVVAVDGGYKAFESVADYETWVGQV